MVDDGTAPLDGGAVVGEGTSVTSWLPVLAVVPVNAAQAPPGPATARPTVKRAAQLASSSASFSC